MEIYSIPWFKVERQKEGGMDGGIEREYLLSTGLLPNVSAAEAGPSCQQLSRSPVWEAGTQLLDHDLLSPHAHQREAGTGGLRLRYSGMECRHPGSVLSAGLNVYSSEASKS